MKIGSWKFLTKTVIGNRTDPLMIRYVLFRCDAFGVYIHKFLRSDFERALHDHPWSFVAIILKGGYWEVHDQTIDGSEVKSHRRPGEVLVRSAEWRHRVQLPHRNVMDDSSECVPSWSLCIAGRRCRPWGFFVKWFETANMNARGEMMPHSHMPGGAPYSTVAVERKAWCPWKRYDTTKGICVEQDLHDGED